MKQKMFGIFVKKLPDDQKMGECITVSLLLFSVRLFKMSQFYEEKKLINRFGA